MIHPDHTPRTNIDTLALPKTLPASAFRQVGLDQEFVQKRLSEIEGEVSSVSKRANLYHYRVPLPHLPEQFDGFRILHLSDIHFHRHSPRRIEEFERLIGELRDPVDVVAITGDTIADSPLDLGEREISALQEIGRGAEKLFVMGNHDYYGDSEAFVRASLESVGYSELKNDSISVVRGEAAISFYGTDDFLEGQPYPPQSGELHEGNVNILLTHNLDAFQSYYPDIFDVALSGHLHAGEVRLGPLSVLNAMKLFGFSLNLNEQIVGWDLLSERCLSYVSPGQARHSLNFNTVKPGATIIELVR